MTDLQREELVERVARIILGPKSHWNTSHTKDHLEKWAFYPEVQRALAKAEAVLEALSALQVVGNEEAGVSQSQPCGDGGRAAPTEAEPSAAFNLRDLAEVATKAIYTHGFGFREVIGPSHHGHSEYVNFCWDDDTIVRAVFSLHPDETPDALAKAGTARSPQPIREDQSIDRRSDTLSVGLDAGGSGMITLHRATLDYTIAMLRKKMEAGNAMGLKIGTLREGIEDLEFLASAVPAERLLDSPSVPQDELIDISEQLAERVAVAIRNLPPITLTIPTERVRADHLTTPPQQPQEATDREGWVLVPREPTEEMIEAAESALTNWRKTLSPDEAMARSYMPPEGPRRFRASATPAEKHAIRYRAMLSAVSTPSIGGRSGNTSSVAGSSRGYMAPTDKQRSAGKED